jgi:hypothetical protein
MAQPTNTFDSYDSIGNRESLANLISLVAVSETPFLSGLKTTKISSTFHEWQTLALSAINDNKVIEGDEASLDASLSTARVGNYSQISDKTVVVSNTLDAVNRAGRKKEKAFQMLHKSTELKKDMEHAMIGLSNARVAGNASTARELASVQAWIATNDVFNSSGSPNGASGNGTGSNTRTDSGTAVVFTEAMFTSALDLIFESGGNPDVVHVGSFNKRKMNAFTGRADATRSVVDGNGTINDYFDVYRGDYGTLKIVPNRLVRTRDCLILDSDKWSIGYLRPFTTQPLSVTGDSEKSQLIVEYTLISENEKASGGVFDLTVA